MLKVDQISCRYGQVEVLHQVSLHLEQGEILGLLGRNGAGKTTLLKCLMGLLPLVSGKIVMNDEILSGKRESVLCPRDAASFRTSVLRKI